MKLTKEQVTEEIISGKSLKDFLEWKDDRKVVLEAVKQYGWDLEYASEKLKDDKEVVLAAVKKDGRSLQYASERLRDDKDVILEAIKYGWAFLYASERLKDDKGVVLHAIKKDGGYLQYVSQRLRDGKYDREPGGTGFNFGLIAENHEFFGREETIKIDSIFPKDSEGILYSDLDVTISFVVNKNKAVEFIVKTGDMEQDVNRVYHLGLSRVNKTAINVIGKTSVEFSSVAVSADPEILENALKKNLQNALDEEFGKETFKIEEVKTSNVKVARIVEERIQNIAVINAEKAKADAYLAAKESKKQMLKQDAEMLAQVSSETGVSIDDLIRYKLIEVIKESDNTKTVIEVDANKKPKI